MTKEEFLADVDFKYIDDHACKVSSEFKLLLHMNKLYKNKLLLSKYEYISFHCSSFT